MKGLLLKDLYALRAYFPVFFIMNAVFVIVSCIAPMDEGIQVMNMPGMAVFAGLWTGCICTTLISYEEREKWDVYSRTLPVTEKMLVTEKYVVAAVLAIGVSLLKILAQLVFDIFAGSPDLLSAVNTAGLMLAMALLASSVLLPCVYRFGAEKGRLAYFLAMGFGSAVMAMLKLDSRLAISWHWLAVLLAAAAVLFALSRLISVRIFQSRE